MQMIKLSVIALAVAAASTQMAVASQQSESNGFIEDSSLNAHARALYFNRDFRYTVFLFRLNNSAGSGSNALHRNIVTGIFQKIVIPLSANVQYITGRCCIRSFLSHKIHFHFLCLFMG